MRKTYEGDKMVREIKFRGMDIHGNWHYGNLSVVNIPYKNIEVGCYISNSAGLPFAYLLRPETAGQFTGILDKNDKEIYEGDIVAIHNKGEYREEEPVDGKAEVKFLDGAFICMGFYAMRISKSYSNQDSKWEMEVIGNIYENKDLI